MGRTISLGHLQLFKPGQDERKRRVSSGVYPELKWAEVSTHASGGSSDAHSGRDEAPPTGTRCHVVLEAEGPNIKALVEPVPPAGSERESQAVRASPPAPGASRGPCASRGSATQCPILCCWRHVAFLASASASSRALLQSHWI